MKKMICLLAVCLLLAVMSVGVSANADVSAMMQQLPTVEAFQTMDADAQLEAYNQVQAAYDAYMALTEEERSAISGAEETFEALFAHFNSLVMPVEEVQVEAQGEEIKSTEERIGTIVTYVAAFAVGFAAMNLAKKRKWEIKKCGRLFTCSLPHRS